MLGADHLQERQVRVDARRHDVGGQVVAVLEHDADRGAVLDDDLRDRRLGADLDARLARGAGDRFGDRAGAAARQAPRAERAVDLAHVVVQQHVGGARRAHAEERADDARRRHRRLEHVGLEPLIEEVDRAHRHQLDLVVLVVVARAPGSAGRGTADPCRPRGSSDVGSGGVMSRIGFTKRPISTIALPYSS